VGRKNESAEGIVDISATPPQGIGSERGSDTVYQKTNKLQDVQLYPNQNSGQKMKNYANDVVCFMQKKQINEKKSWSRVLIMHGVRKEWPIRVRKTWVQLRHIVGIGLDKENDARR